MTEDKVHCCNVNLPELTAGDEGIENSCRKLTEADKHDIYQKPELSCWEQ